MGALQRDHWLSPVIVGPIISTLTALPEEVFTMTDKLLLSQIIEIIHSIFVPAIELEMFEHGPEPIGLIKFHQLEL